MDNIKKKKALMRKDVLQIIYPLTQLPNDMIVMAPPVKFREDVVIIEIQARPLHGFHTMCTWAQKKKDSEFRMPTTRSPNPIPR
jgi:hypothetical protein